MIQERMRMKILLFDLGDTLEQNDILLPGALDMLQAVQQLHDPNGRPPVLGLVSDFFPLTEEIARRQQEYYDLLQRLHIRSFFEPVEERVTLSTEMVSFIFKPDERIFRKAVDKINPGGAFSDTMFITEKRSHVEAARALGMKAIHVRAPGQTTGDVQHLIDLVPLIRDFVEAG
jgi:FMN phosphatase YigB (HAD superfamily)